MRKLPSVQKNLSIGALNILRPPKGTKATADFWHVLGDIAAILLVLVTYGVEKCVRTHLPHYSNHWDPQLLFEWLFIIKKNYGLFVDFLTSEGWCLKITEKVSLKKAKIKLPKIVHFGEFLKTWCLRSNSVTRQVNFNMKKMVENAKVSNFFRR